MARRELEDWYWQVEQSLQRLHHALSSSTAIPGRGTKWQPRVDLKEDSRKFILKIELAGVRPEDLRVSYVPGRHSLLIQGVRHEPEDGPGPCKGIHLLEILYGEFEREIQLPEKPVEPESLRLQNRSGFMIVTIPKARQRVHYSRVTIRKL